MNYYCNYRSTYVLNR